MRAKQVGLAIAELDYFTIGMIFDLIDAFIEDQKDIEADNINKPKVKRANQEDFDKF